MSWIFKRDSETIVLPVGPQKVQKRKLTNLKEITRVGTKPYVYVFGLKSDQLVLQGYLAKEGESMSYVEANYITPLESWVHSEISLVAPGSRYDGNYLLREFTYTEKGGTVAAVEYKITLISGYQHIVAPPP